MASTKFALVRGRALRVTKLNGCGAIQPGSRSTVTTEGFISIGLTANNEEGETISVTNAAGNICILDQPSPKFTGYSIEVQFCGVDPDLFSLMTGQPLVFDANGQLAIGLQVNSDVSVDSSGFAMEMWSNVPVAACSDSGATSYGYMLIPFVKGGTLGDVTIENGAINFTLSGASSKDGNGWGVGPYNVVPGVGSTSEVQTVTISGAPTGGTFTLTYKGQTTSAIAYNAANSAVDTALEALSTIGEGNVTVSGGPGPTTPYVVTFGGALAGTNVAQMTASGAGLTGGTAPSVAVTTTTSGVGGTAGPLLVALPTTNHLHLQLTTIAPPSFTEGGTSLGTEATGATAGIPATLTPANSYPPANLTDAQTGFTATPATAWTTGQYVLLEDGSKAHWNATTWVAGAKP